MHPCVCLLCTLILLFVSRLRGNFALQVANHLAEEVGILVSHQFFLNFKQQTSECYFPIFSLGASIAHCAFPVSRALYLIASILRRHQLTPCGGTSIGFLGTDVSGITVVAISLRA
jgi:hypothetical protein